MILLSLILLAAQEPTVPGVAPAKAENPGKLICKSRLKTGSRTSFIETCHTKAEWDAVKRENRSTVERGQQQQNRNDPVQGRMQ